MPSLFSSSPQATSLHGLSREGSGVFFWGTASQMCHFLFRVYVEDHVLHGWRVLVVVTVCLKQYFSFQLNCEAPDILSREINQDLSIEIRCPISCSLEPRGAVCLRRLSKGFKNLQPIACSRWYLLTRWVIRRGLGLAWSYLSWFPDQTLWAPCNPHPPATETEVLPLPFTIAVKHRLCNIGMWRSLPIMAPTKPQCGLWSP